MHRSIHRRPFLGALAATAASTVFRAPPVGAAVPLGLQGSWVNDAEFIGYYVALDRGWYEAEGLDLTYHPGGPDVIPESALPSGMVDVALASPDSIMKAVVDEGAPLKIIGAQYQKNPLCVVSLAENPIHEPADVVGKTLAVSSYDVIAVEAVLRLNGIDPRSVQIVPYTYGLAPLLAGEIDGSGGFITNEPFELQVAGKEVVTLLLYDYGFTIYSDIVVVTEETLAARRADLVGFLRASRRGWVENFRYPEAWPLKFVDSWFQGTGRSIESELFFNVVQEPLIQHPDGIFTMTEDDIAKNIDALAQIGIEAPREVFDATLLAEI